MTGKIIKGIAGFYYVHDGHSKIYECKAKGVFRNKKIKPLVGDDVEFTVLDQEICEGNIISILPRKNVLIRPAVSNIDQAVVIFSVTHPEPNLNLLDRFLVMMEVQQIPVILCFNKIDLIPRDFMEQYRTVYEHAGYHVCFTSAHEQLGIEQLKTMVKGKTTVLAGPSGVGKSSITNLIFPGARMEIGNISKKIQRGKHTTRHSELFFIGDSTFMMDTPGFSSMYIENMEANQLKDYFPEFESYEENCKFLGCVHIGETICGVKEALADGKLSRSRYDNYTMLYQELKDKRRY